jgi:tRNA G46 methylase TrmB
MSPGPTSEESLRELLARVHQRLSQAGSIDEESRRMLATLVHDIGRALGRGTTDVAGHVPHLESLIVRFETDHPGLAELLRQLIDALGKFGI